MFSGCSWGLLGLCSAALAGSWVPLGPLLRGLGALLGSSRVALEAILGPLRLGVLFGALGALLVRFDLYLDRNSSLKP